MENASKALLMAAGVLIGVLILTLAVYLFATFGATSAELHKQQATDKLNQFNSQFTSYEGKDGLTIYDAITVANLATENNKYYDIPTRSLNINALTNQTDNYVSVFIKGKNYAYGVGKTSNDVNDKYELLISTELATIKPQDGKEELPEYECETYISSITQRVYKVVFTQKP